jgi:hypothetical protein
MITAQDVIHHLLTFIGGGAQEGEHQTVRSAVVHGVREVMQSRQWLWHMKTGQFTTEQIFTTATISQGSKTITVANANGMVSGRILGVPAQFFPRTPRIVSVAGTQVTLDYAATATGSGVQVFPQTYYDLPLGVREIDTLISDTVGTLHCYVSPQEWQRLEVNTVGVGDPYYYTIMRSDVHPDRYQVRFVGVPTNGVLMHYTYRYAPEPVKYMGYERTCRQGAVRATGLTVSGEGSDFQPAQAGRVIRFGTDTREADPVGSLSPFQHERMIVDVTAPAALTINASLVTGPLKYAISDAIDCSPQMYTAILSAAEMWYARMTNKNANEALVVFTRDLRLAMETDQVYPISNRFWAGSHPNTRTMGWKSPVLPDLT